MTDKIITEDPSNPGVLKINGPNLNTDGTIALTSLSTSGASNGDAVTLQGGSWTPAPQSGGSSTASNVGTGAGVFKTKVGNDFQFRSFIAGVGISISQNADTITINGTLTVGGVCLISDVKAAGTNGGSITQNVWNTRTLNTKSADTIGVTLAANQFTLPSGTYVIIGRGPTYQCQNSLARLYNITDAAITLSGNPANNANMGLERMNGDSWVIGVFTIAASKTFEFQQNCGNSRPTDGFGVAANFGTDEIYTELLILKI